MPSSSDDLGAVVLALGERVNFGLAVDGVLSVHVDMAVRAVATAGVVASGAVVLGVPEETLVRPGRTRRKSVHEHEQLLESGKFGLSSPLTPGSKLPKPGSVQPPRSPGLKPSSGLQGSVSGSSVGLGVSQQ